MVKDILCAVLILCVFNLTSCYTHKSIRSIDDIKKEDLSKYSSIKIKTVEGTTQTFNKGSIADNSFIGSDKKGVQSTIELEKVAEFKLEKFNIFNTVAVVAIGCLVGFAIFGVILVTSMGEM